MNDATVTISVKDDLPEVKEEMDRLQKEVAEAKEQEREQCCRDVCYDCYVGRPLTGRRSPVARHEVITSSGDKITRPCKANDIRQRAINEKSESEKTR